MFSCPQGYNKGHVPRPILLPNIGDLRLAERPGQPVLDLGKCSQALQRPPVAVPCSACGRWLRERAALRLKGKKEAPPEKWGQNDVLENASTWNSTA